MLFFNAKTYYERIPTSKTPQRHVTERNRGDN